MPPAAIPGGEFQIRGVDFAGERVLFGDAHSPIIVGSDQLIVARVPEPAPQAPLFVENDSERSQPWTCEAFL